MYISTHPVLHYTQYVCPSLGGKAKGVGDSLVVVSDSLGLVDFAIGLVNSVLNLPGKWSFVGNSNCVLPKNIYTPPPPKGGHFCFRPLIPWNLHSRGCLSYPPPPAPCNFRNFPTWLGTPWKEYFRQKMPFTVLLPHSPLNFRCPPWRGVDMFWNYTLQKNVYSILLIINFFGLVHASYSLPF